MGAWTWATAVPFVIFLLRKYREYSWGTCRDVRPLQNKVFLITGASSGLGKETAKELARRKARIIMACRDLDKAAGVIEEIRSEIKTGELIPMELDLASLTSVHSFADAVVKDFPRIDVLINNAGVSVPPSLKRTTEDGFEINLGINHLGHFYLTNLLLDKIIASKPSRIVMVASGLFEGGRIEFDNLQGEKGFSQARRNQAYNNSKLANVYFCRELSQRLPQGVETYAVCPGLCYTDLFRYSSLKWFHYIMLMPIALFFLRSANKGCQTILHCAVSDDVLGHSGLFFKDCKQYVTNFNFEPEVQEKLWDVSSNLVGLENASSD